MKTAQKQPVGRPKGLKKTPVNLNLLVETKEKLRQKAFDDRISMAEIVDDLVKKLKI